MLFINCYTFEWNSVSYRCSLQPANSCFVSLSSCFASLIGQGPSNHTSLLYELLVSVLWFTLSFGEVSKTCIKMHKMRRHTYTRKKFNSFYSFVYFVFPAFINNPSNFEINRLIKLVVSGMFLLQYSASFITFSSLLSHF